MLDSFRSWLMTPPHGNLVIAGLVLVVFFVGWLWWGPGPRRRRCLRQARHFLHQTNWQQALRLLRQQQPQRWSAKWQARWTWLESECHATATTQALTKGDFEKALEHAPQAALCWSQTPTQAKERVIEAMLEEVRRLFATSAGADTGAILHLLTRVFLARTPCAEASFWQGLCHLRRGEIDLAIPCLQTARAGDQTPDDGQAAPVGSASPSPLPTFIDPSLYLGSLLLRQGQAKEALRYLAEAKRIDGNCPFVLWLLGMALIEAGGDTQLAVRALQQSLKQGEMAVWLAHPQKAWADGMPKQRSYVRRLALSHPFVCPLWGGDLTTILRQTRLALGNGYYRLAQYQEAAATFDKLLQETAPSLPVLRGLGLALARLGQYDQAFKHLRVAHELEDPKERFTAGYLALCGAKGKPSKEEDKARNVAWAIRMVTRFEAFGDAEWAGLVGDLFAEARALNLPLAVEDQLYLCDHLVSVFATDAEAAAAYHHLLATHADAVRPEHAWHFCRAAQQHGCGGPCTLALFARTFREGEAARAFFHRRQWDFEAIEITYLERAAELAPGAFPTALGPDYIPRGENLLRLRSLRQEQANQPEAALATVEVWFKLAPHSSAAHDRLANLYYKRGDQDRTLAILQAWHALAPADPLPLVRQAVIQQQRGEFAACLASVRQALGLTSGRQRGELAFLGGRLVLQQAFAGGDKEGNGSAAVHLDCIREAIPLLEECLRDRPDHAAALSYLVGARWLVGDREGLAALAEAMDRPAITEPSFHFLAAVCHYASGHFEAVPAACQRVVDLWQTEKKTGQAHAAGNSQLVNLAVESKYLAGLACLALKDMVGAMSYLREAAADATSPSHGHGQALLGQLCFAQGLDPEAIQWWQALDPKKRAAWQLTEALAGTIFRAAVAALQAGRFEEAAAQIREAGKLGWRERRLGPLLTLALFKAGQQIMYQQ